MTRFNSLRGSTAGPDDERPLRSGLPAGNRQKPLLNALGTPPADKKLVLLEAGHAMVGFPASTRESLDWLDRYLGPVPIPILQRQ